jgi:hypothetical protein
VGRGPVRFENSTFVANHASQWGGAISYDARQITLASCTLAHNTAGESVGALYGAETPTPVVTNSIFFANGDAGAGRHCRRSLAATATIVYPATDDDACGATLHVDPLLEAELADHGGFTRTLAPGVGSPALGAGTSCPATDQRGEPRPAEGCDLGAFERD